VIGALPDITVDTAAASTAVTYALPGVTDNEDPSPDITCSPASGSQFRVGQTRVTCTATDANGNVATKTFTVTVRGLLNVGANVPATLSLTLGAPASFGSFVPGVPQVYTASTTANVISTAGDAALTVSDPSPTHTGRLVNGTVALPQPLQGLGTVKTYSAPVSNDVVTVQFRQPVASTDALRTGVYAKTLTFTLSTTNP
jgi:X-Pro dipeptidyl-peptidase